MGSGSSHSRPPDIHRQANLASREIRHDNTVPLIQSEDSSNVEENLSSEINETSSETNNYTDQNSIQPVPNSDTISDLESILSSTVDEITEPRMTADETCVPSNNNISNQTQHQKGLLQPPTELNQLKIRTNNVIQSYVKTTHDLQAETENEWNFKKESLDGFDPTKFKIVNSQRNITNNIQKLSGDYSNQEQPSLLWRLGLASPADAYPLKTSNPKYVETRHQLPKPPSYDPTEEQLMAMIEKEYA